MIVETARGKITKISGRALEGGERWLIGAANGIQSYADWRRNSNVVFQSISGLDGGFRRSLRMRMKAGTTAPW